jgi:hypothetical protein
MVLVIGNGILALEKVILSEQRFFVLCFWKTSKAVIAVATMIS